MNTSNWRKDFVGQSARRALAWSLALILQVFAVSALAQTPGPVVIPRDEAPHPNDSMEWWYFTGHVTGEDPSGKTHSYGFELTFIRMDAIGLEPWGALYNAQFAITDLTRGTFEANENVFSFQADVIPPGGGFDNTVATWHMEGREGSDKINAEFSDLSYGAWLTLEQSTPPALHGDKGIIPYGVFGTSAYYSYTHLKASGTILDHGVPVTVTGIAWQDHQYGDFLAGPGGWHWFSIQLDDGTQYMLYFLRDANQNLVQKVGTQVNPDGTTIDLDPSALTETPLGSWMSLTSGITYTQNWTVTVPGGNRDGYSPRCRSIRKGLC